MERSFLEKTLSFLSIFTIFAMPLIVLPGRLFPFTTSKSFFFMGMAELCFFIWIYLAVTLPEYRLSKKQILIFCLPAVLLLSLTISGILAPSKNLAFWSSFERGTGLIFLYHCFAFALVVASLVKVHGRSFLKKIFWAVYLSGIILAISTFFTATQGGLMGNSSYAGAYLIFSFFLGAILLFENKEAWGKILIILGEIIILIAPFIIGARGAALALFSGAIIAFITLLITFEKKIIRFTGIALLLATLLGIIISGFLFLESNSKLHLAFAGLDRGSRLTFWNAAVQGIKERPVLGWGPENYSIVFAKYFDPSTLEPDKSNETWVDKPHNAALESFVAGGLVGGILFLVFVLLLFALPIYLYKKKNFSRAELALLVGLFSAYFLQDFIVFDTVSTYVIIFALFGVFTGRAPVFPEAKSAKKISSLPQALKFFTAGACVAMFIPVWIIFSHFPSKKAKEIYSLYNKSSSEKNFSSVAGISPMGNGWDAGYGADLMAGTYEADIGNIKADPKLVMQAVKDINSFLEQADKLSGAAASDYRLWYSCGKLVAIDMTITGNLSDDLVSRALMYLDRAAKLSPADPRIYIVYGQIYTYKKEFAKAHEYFVQALNLDPDIPFSKEHLDQFEKIFGTKF